MDKINLKSVDGSTAPDSQTGVVSFLGVDGDGNLVKSLNGYLTPEMYGAKGDGVTNDVVAVQAAIDAAIALKLPLNLSEGLFRCTSSLSVTDADLSIICNNPRNGLYFDHTGTGFIYTSTVDNHLLRIQGGRYIGGTGVDEGFNITFPAATDISRYQVKFEDMEISGPYSTGCVTMTNVVNPEVRSCVFKGGGVDTTPYGLSLAGQCLDAEVHSSKGYLLGNFVQHLGTSEGLTIVQCTAVTVDKGVYANTTGYEPHDAISLCHFNTRTAGIHLINRAEVFITNNLLYCNNTAGEPGWIGIDIEATGSVFARNVKIIANSISKTVYAGTTLGVKLVRCLAGSIEANSFYSMDGGLSIDSASSNVKLGVSNTYEGVTTPRVLNALAVVPVLGVSGEIKANGFEYTGGASGTSPSVNVVGSDTAIGMTFLYKGPAVFQVGSDRGISFVAQSSASALNYPRLRSQGTGSNAVLDVLGETNVGLDLIGRGTKGVRLLDSAGVVKFEINGTGIGYFGNTPVARKTGWGVATGTATRTTFDTTSVTLPELAEHLKALIDDLHSTAGYGLITS